MALAYIVSFARYSESLVENREMFISHLYLSPRGGMAPSEFREVVWYPYNYNDCATV